jgi:diguanylate cyclase (GGDEF)-like protein
MSKETSKLPVVLIVDDDEMTRLLVTETLEPQGFVVEEASSGEEGLDVFRRVRPDLILLDVNMPGISGFECCERLRLSPGGERLPILVLTGQDDDESIAHAYAAGATDFVAKPMRWKILGHHVRYLLRASQALEDLTRSEASLAYAQGLAHVGNWEWRPGNACGHLSGEMCRILRLDPELAPPTFGAFLQVVPENERGRLTDAFIKLFKNGAKDSLEHRIVHADGSERIVFQQAEAERDERGHAILLRGTMQDITERRMYEARIEYLATHDALTDLPNRNLLGDRIAQSIAQTHRAGERLALLFLDLDRFKFINDSFGHTVGDGLLKAVAARLLGTVRDSDTVARLGGDEFVIMAPGLIHAGDAANVAKKILATFAVPFVVAGRELHVTASIGVSIYPEDGDNSNTLLKSSDAAMYRAKEQGRNGFQHYTREMSVQAQERVELESALCLALERQEFELHYQPQVDLNSGQITGVEALIRWHHPTLGMVSPLQFIPLAEETGLILAIGEWVLKTACAQAVAWHLAGYPQLSMSVNLSARQFRQHYMAGLVASALAETGLAAEYLVLELTESLLMKDSHTIVQALRELKAMGVVLSLDDFGTGYSSLSYLKRFPIDVVKIDRSFVHDVTSNVDGASLTKTIITMAQSLKLKTVAEGVETKAQLSFLKRNGCDSIQGYYFSRPLPANEMLVLLHEGKHIPAASMGDGPIQRTVLLVDDDEDDIGLLSHALRSDGYQILTAPSAKSALELLALYPVGVIISDAHMPEMSGIEFLCRVKELYPEIGRIMLSGHTELQMVTDAVNESGVHKFLTKQWNEGLLRKDVAEAFRHHELVSERWLASGKQPAHHELLASSEGQADLTLESHAV